MVDRIVRKVEAARLLGVSPTSLWRLEREGSLRAVAVLPGLAGFRESELQAFVESRGRVELDRSRVAAALRSPRHGRAGREPRAVAPESLGSEPGESRPADDAAAPAEAPAEEPAPVDVSQKAEAWISANWPADVSLQSRDDLRGLLRAIRPPEELEESVFTALLPVLGEPKPEPVPVSAQTAQEQAPMISEAPKACPMCSSPLRSKAGLYVCLDADSLGCTWMVRARASMEGTGAAQAVGA